MSIYISIKIFQSFLKKQIKFCAVMIAEKNILATITTQNNMIKSARIMYAGFAGQVSNIIKKYSVSHQVVSLPDKCQA